MTNRLYLLRGKLRVEALGYWYSAAGAKGSFGYYPHLKDEIGRPVIADTQVHGDLRMAAVWLKNLAGVDESLVDQLFGKRGNESSALLHVGDLRLAVSENWNPQRFQVKPRIEIDDTTRTVRDKMLANFELSWLQDLRLEAPICTGYFDNAETMKKARALLDEATQLLSGFGAFRSRGYGRGRIVIAWDEPEIADPTPSESTLPAACFQYSLESLVNFRSKPVAVEKRQLLTTALTINSKQLRGWFVRTFHRVYRRWPDLEEMAAIRFPDLYPASSRAELSFPPPVTTLRKEDDSTIEDYWGRTPESSENFASGENFSSSAVAVADTEEPGKIKPLKSGTFCSVSGRMIRVEATRRMRNAIDANWLTLDQGGLFVQEYLRQGTIFCGEIVISDRDSNFSRQAWGVLSTLKPEINGTIFAPVLTPGDEADASAEDRDQPRLTIAPLAFDPDRNRHPEASLLVGTNRCYSSVLGRPRRGRPVVLPGSVLVEDSSPGTIPWPWFGKTLPGAATPLCEKRSTSAKGCKIPSVLAKEKIDWKKFTRSQAGILRELLNPDHNPAAIGMFLENIYQKHSEKQKESDLAKTYKVLSACQRDKGLVVMREVVKELLDYLKSEIWWQEKMARAQKMQQEGKRL